MEDGRPLLIVGDVQGDSERLEQALGPYPPDAVTTVFLGDFFQGGVANGAGGAACAKLARERPHSHCVMGNHELFILCVLEELQSRHVLLPNRSSSTHLIRVWQERRGDWADLECLATEGELEQWVRELPLVWKAPDGTLAQHCDDVAYAQLGGSVDEINERARDMLKTAGGARALMPYVVGRGGLKDRSAVESYLQALGGSRIVHGHTSHRGLVPTSSHDGLVWNFDGMFSRYWVRLPSEAPAGPIAATVGLLPVLA